MKRIAITLGAMLAAVCGAQAQMTLTLDKAIEIALSDNPTIQVAEMEIERFDYVRNATLGQHLPSLKVDARYNYAAKAQQMSKSLKFAADGTNSVNATATLSVPLFVPALYKTMQLNRTQMESAVESSRGSRINLVADVKKTFYNILLAQKSLEVLAKSSEIAQKSVDDTQIKFDNGLVAEYDLLTAQVQYSNLQPTIIQTRYSLDMTKLMLKMYLSLPEDVEIDVEGSLTEMRDFVFDGTDELTTDVSENSDLKTLEFQADMLTEQLKISNTSYLPTLAAFGTASYYGSEVSSIVMGPTGMGSGPIEYYGQWPVNVGLNLSIPIFSGNVNRNNGRQIKNQIKQLELQTYYAKQGKIVEARSAINNLLSARERMHAEQKTIEQATKAFDISTVRYDAGAGTILELNSAQLALTQSELNYSQAVYDFLTAKADYDKVIGRESANIE